MSAVLQSPFEQAGFSISASFPKTPGVGSARFPRLAVRNGVVLWPDWERPQDAAGKRALVVDDDPLMCYYLAEYLTDAGYEVVVSHDSIDAIGIFSHDPASFGLVLIDHYLPGSLTGTEAASYLGNSVREGESGAKIVVMTGDTTLRRPERSSGLSIDHLVYKPLTGSVMSSLLATRGE